MVTNQWKSFTDAKKFVHKLNIRTLEWRDYCKSGKLPKNIPKNPPGTYKDEWKGWGDWVGSTNHHTPNQWCSFEDARKFAQSLKLKNKEEWKNYYKSGKLPKNIPKDPQGTYGKKRKTKYAGYWTSWGDFLGTGFVANQVRNFLSFEDARKFVHTLNLKTTDEWFDYGNSGKLPKNIPRQPYATYKNKGWKGMGDWLGTGNIALRNRVYLPFSKARTFIHSLSIQNSFQWRDYCKSGKKPADIPANPPQVYKKEWNGWRDWLGGEPRVYRGKWRSFEDARKFVHTLKFSGQDAWREYTKSGKKPADIPVVPSKSYKDKWISWGDWFGTGFVATFKMNFRSFEDARKFSQSLNISGQAEWAEYCKSGKKPADIPANPKQVYQKKYTSSGDWLGTGFVATRHRKYLPIKEAKIAARKIAKDLGITTHNQWFDAWRTGKIPDYLPMNLANTYDPEYRGKEKLRGIARRKND